MTKILLHKTALKTPLSGSHFNFLSDSLFCFTPSSSPSNFFFNLITIGEFAPPPATERGKVLQSMALFTQHRPRAQNLHDIGRVSRFSFICRGP